MIWAKVDDHIKVYEVVKTGQFTYRPIKKIIDTEDTYMDQIIAKEKHLFKNIREIFQSIFNKEIF